MRVIKGKYEKNGYLTYDGGDQCCQEPCIHPRSHSHSSKIPRVSALLGFSFSDMNVQIYIYIVDIKLSLLLNTRNGISIVT